MPLKPSGQTPTSSPPRSIRSASSLQARVAPPLRARSPTSGQPEDEVGAERAQEPAGVVVDATRRSSGRRPGTVPEWLETTRAPPSAGMFSAPRTSTRNHFSRDRAQRGQQEPLGDLLVEAVVVDGEVTGEPATQEREELGQAGLPAARRRAPWTREVKAASHSSGGMPATGVAVVGRHRGAGRDRGGLVGLDRAVTARRTLCPEVGDGCRVGSALPGGHGPGRRPVPRAAAPGHGTSSAPTRDAPVRRGAGLPARLRLLADGLSSPVPRPGCPRVPDRNDLGVTHGCPLPEVRAPTRAFSVARTRSWAEETRGDRVGEVGERLRRW